MDLCQGANISIDDIVESAEYQIDEQFQNLLIFWDKVSFSKLEKFKKFVNFLNCNILIIYYFTIWKILKIFNLENSENLPNFQITIIQKFIK